MEARTHLQSLQRSRFNLRLHVELEEHEWARTASYMTLTLDFASPELPNRCKCRKLAVSHLDPG